MRRMRVVHDVLEMRTARSGDAGTFSEEALAFQAEAQRETVDSVTPVGVRLAIHSDRGPGEKTERRFR